jgi:hypothetical protein
MVREGRGRESRREREQERERERAGERERNCTWIQVGLKNKTLNWNEMMHTVRQYVCRSDYLSVVD